MSAAESIGTAGARLNLRNWLQNVSCRLVIAGAPLHGPGGPFNSDCNIIPYTRVSSGLLADFQGPSILDYAAVSQGLQASSFICLDQVPGDHACSVLTVVCFFGQTEAEDTLALQR